MAIATVNPATGELIESYQPYDESRWGGVLDAARRAQRDWAAAEVSARAERLQGMAKVLRARLDEYSSLITLEMGKPISQARAEVEKCAGCVDHYVERGEEYLRPESVDMGVRVSGIRYLPLGVVLGVMPWNYPFWQALRFAIPTLLAGNGTVLKHASNVPGSALALEALAVEAGLPEGLFGTVLVEGGAVTPLIHDDRIAAVSLTGSESVGRRIGAEAGAALKPAVLELGGSDPFIVLADADVAAAARAAATARTLNNGQSCIAAKRFLVDDSVYDDFIDASLAAMGELKFGDPTDPGTELGPMARRDLRDELHGQVMATVGDGARLAAGGQPPAGPGAYYPATLLIDARTREWPASTRNSSALPASSPERNGEAALVELANASRYGLGASIWSADPNVHCAWVNASMPAWCSSTISCAATRASRSAGSRPLALVANSALLASANSSTSKPFTPGEPGDHEEWIRLQHSRRCRLWSGRRWSRRACRPRRSPGRGSTRCTPGCSTEHEALVVFATAGSGKTIQAQMFASREKWPLAWLTLDGADRSPSRMLSYLARALRPHVAGIEGRPRGGVRQRTDARGGGRVACRGHRTATPVDRDRPV